MFYLENEKWVPYKKKIVRTITTTSYSDCADGHPEDAVISDVELTAEQQERLMVVNEISSIPNYEVAAFVVDGIKPESEEVIGSIERYYKEMATDELIASLPEDVIEEQAELLTKIAAEWNGNGRYYKPGKQVKYKDVLYVVIEPGHTSQPDWSPDKAVSLFSKVLTSPAGPLPWVQSDSTNPYRLGDKVTHNGKTWESTNNANVWEPGSPGVYDNIWCEVKV